MKGGGGFFLLDSGTATAIGMAIAAAIASRAAVIRTIFPVAAVCCGFAGTIAMKPGQQLRG